MLKVNHSQISTFGTLATFGLLYPSIASAPLAHVDAFGAVLAGAVAGSIAPDLDIKIPSILPTLLVRAVMLPFPKYRKKNIVASHRTYTHCLAAVVSLLLVFAAAGVFFGFNSPLTLLVMGLLGGWIFHMLADMTTYHGVPLLWPISERKSHILPKFLRFATGKSVKETIYTYSFNACALVLIYLHIISNIFAR